MRDAATLRKDREATDVKSKDFTTVLLLVPSLGGGASVLFVHQVTTRGVRQFEI